MVCTRKNKNQQKRKLSLLNRTLNDFIIGNGTNVNAMENETLEQQTNGPRNDFEKFNNYLSQNQVIESNTDDRIRNAVGNAVVAVENCFHDAILRAMNNVIIPRVEMTVRLMTGSSGNGFNSKIQNPNQRDFTVSTEKTPLRAVSSRLGLSIEQDEIDVTHDFGNSEYGDFPSTKLNYDRRAHAHHRLLLFIAWVETLRRLLFRISIVVWKEGVKSVAGFYRKQHWIFPLFSIIFAFF